MAFGFAGVTEAAREGGMRIPLRQQLINHSLSIITAIRPLADKIARHDRDLDSQLRRALNSVVLNVAEGLGCEGGNLRLRFQSARGSLNEAFAALKVAQAWGYVSETEVEEVAANVDSLAARLYGLARR